MKSILIILACVACTYGWNKYMEVPGLYQGDIQLSPEQQQGIINGSHTFGSIVGRRWTNGIVPYQIESSIGATGKNAIAAAINDYHKYTCLKFVQKTNQRNYVSFFRGTGCNSPVGMVGRNRISLEAPGCQNKGTTMHEIGHTIGLHHEQCRPDRDSYVRINYQNINGPWAYAFNIERSVNSLGFEYDLKSMMHYSSTAFARRGTKTIVTNDRTKQSLIDTYNRITGFSDGDIKQINKMYEKECGGRGPQGGTDTGTGTGTGSTCVDNNSNCPAWAARGECQRSPGYMLRNCKKSCKVAC